VALAELVQYVATGLLVGGVYALMSIGLALIFGVMRVVNFAQGDFMMLGMYLTYFYAISGSVDPLLGALLTIPPFFVLGWIVHRGLLARVTGGGDPQRQMDAQLILTLGLSLVITNATTMILTPTPLGIRTGYATQAFTLGPVLLNQARSYAFAMALVLATPYAMWELWQFVVPGLHVQERRFVARPAAGVTIGEHGAHRPKDIAGSEFAPAPGVSWSMLGLPEPDTHEANEGPCPCG